jgi:CHASE3 domain sensor protein
MNRFSLRTNIIIGLVTLFFLLIATFLFTMRNSQRFIENERLLSQQQENIDNLKTTLTLMLDLETGKRGFILTGKSEFLEPYERAKEKLPVYLEALKKKITDPEGVRGLILLEDLIR